MAPLCRHLGDKPQGQLAEGLLKNYTIILSKGLLGQLVVLQVFDETLFVIDCMLESNDPNLHCSGTHRKRECRCRERLVEGIDYYIAWGVPCLQLF
jgi:hypothetical protein